MTTEQRLKALEVSVNLLELTVNKLVTQMNNTASKTTVNRALALTQVDILSIQQTLTQLQNNIELFFEQNKIQ